MPIRDVCYQINKLRTGLAYHLNRIDLMRTQHLSADVFKDLDLGETFSGGNSPAVLLSNKIKELGS